MNKRNEIRSLSKLIKEKLMKVEDKIFEIGHPTAKIYIVSSNDYQDKWLFDDNYYINKAVIEYGNIHFNAINVLGEQKRYTPEYSTYIMTENMSAADIHNLIERLNNLQKIEAKEKPNKRNIFKKILTDDLNSFVDKLNDSEIDYLLDKMTQHI